MVDGNPIIRWSYRVWCETGYHNINNVGTNQFADPLPDPSRDLVSPLGYYCRGYEKVMPDGGVQFMDNAWYFGRDVRRRAVPTASPFPSQLIARSIATWRCAWSMKPALTRSTPDRLRIRGANSRVRRLTARISKRGDGGGTRGGREGLPKRRNLASAVVQERFGAANRSNSDADFLVALSRLIYM
jgi:hypothetical protein